MTSPVFMSRKKKKKLDSQTAAVPSENDRFFIV